MKRPRRFKKKLILGVTGSFGSGKTTVARILGSFGAGVIDADRLAHRILKHRPKVYRQIIETFGKGILRKDKSIDRRKLARAVFDKKNLLQRLNNIIHPEVISIIKGKIKTLRSKFIVLDAPLLIEAGLRAGVDKLIVVTTSKKKQIQRIQEKSSLSKADILKRIKCQIPLRAKARLADFVIDNSGTLGNTRRQVKEIFKKITSEAKDNL
jgi:dephospho-CoA kinase